MVIQNIPTPSRINEPGTRLLDRLSVRPPILALALDRDRDLVCPIVPEITRTPGLHHRPQRKTDIGRQNQTVVESVEGAGAEGDVETRIHPLEWITGRRAGIEELTKH